MKKLILVIAAISCAIATAQNPGTGAYQHATFDTPGFDQVNVGNLNVRFGIPIVSKAGRGLPFNYAIQYEGLVWTPVKNTQTNTTSWINDPNWGFTGTLNGNGALGYMTSISGDYVCASWQPPNDPQQQIIYGYYQSNYVYHDAFGAVHSFTYAHYTGCSAGPWGSGQPASTSGSTTASDGSGYLLAPGAGVQTAKGVSINPPAVNYGGSGNNTGLEMDPNGNQITFNGSGSFTDTTGTSELTISGSNPILFTYPVTEQGNSATTAAASLSYRSYTVRTNFGCSGIVEQGSETIGLVDHITLADNVTTYSFTYEPTPGATDGAVTGRLASIKLPTGGTVQYQYQGGSNGVNCADGTTEGLVRTTTSGTTNVSRSYIRPAPGQPANTTLLTDERGKQSYYWFSIDSHGAYEMTHRRVHDGTASGTNLLEEDGICYSGQSPSGGFCDGQGITLPITEADTTTTFNYVNTPVTTKNSYDSFGDLSETQITNGQTPLSSTVNSYYTNPSSVTELTSTTVYDGSGNVVSYTGYGYDESAPNATSSLPQHTTPSTYPGNQTTVRVSVDGTTSNTLTTGFHYYDTGMVQSMATPGNPSGSGSCGSGTISCYGYDSTGTFLTSTVYPTPSSGVGLSTSASFDAASGAVLSATGLNSGQTASVTQYDALLRPTTTTTPNQGSLGQGQSTATYTANQISSQTKMSGSQSTNQETFLDAYGRVVRVAVQSSSGWYVTDSCYDPAGFLQYQSTPYLSSSQNPSTSNCSTSNATQYTHDALGRVTQIASPDGHTLTKTYNGRAVQIADSNGQTRILQKDALGRLVGVCEIVSSATWDGGDATAACGSSASIGGPSRPAVSFDIAGNGFTTAYVYTPSAHSTAVYQGAQTRTFTTDAAGRTVSVTEPESGQTSYAYSYNGTGLQVVRTKPSQNYVGTAGYKNDTTSQYDTMGRIVSISYDDAAHSSVPGFGGTPNRTFTYDQLGNGGSIPNAGSSKGQLTGISNGNHGRSYAYDIMGRVTETVECFPGWCGQPQYDTVRGYQYDLASNLTFEAFTTQPNQQAGYSVSYGYNTAGQLTSLIDGMNNAVGAPNIYTSTASTMQPGGPQFITYGNNLTAYRAYDAMDRYSGQWVCGQPGGYNCPSSTYFYGFGMVMSGSKLVAETDTVNGDWSQYSYDPVGNLSIASSSNGYASNGFTAGYDRYGNRWNESVPNTASGTGPSQGLSFNTATNQINGYIYDTAGNLVNDGQHTYQYDADNNLVMIDNSSTATYWYDALGERVMSASASGTFRYGMDLQGRRSTTWNTSGSVAEAQYYAAGQPVAFWSAADGNIHFEHQDWIGTERMRTDLAGNRSTAATFSSLPFGEPNATSGADLDPGHFAGLDQDGSFSASSLGLHHAMFREYNSILGRWMSPDPYSGSYHLGNPQSLNRYSYVRNNPLAMVDSYGLDSAQIGSDGCIYYGTSENEWLGNGHLFTFDVWSQVLCSGGSANDTGTSSTTAPNKPPCSPTGSLPSSVGFSYGGNADIGGGPNAGFTSTAGVGAGFFHDSAASSMGAFASGGAAGYFGPAYAGTPSQQGQPFSFGAYAGVGPSVWFSNAHTAQQLAGPFTTYSFNAGGGLLKGLSLQLSVGGGIWQLSVGLPIPYSGASTPSLAFSKLTTTTAATHGGCKP